LLLARPFCGYALDARTDWRRAKPANGRRGEVLDDPKKKELPGKVHLGSGQDVYDCLIRKMMSILLLFGDADIGKQGFVSNSHGVVAGTVRWIALEDVFALKKACFGMQKLARDKAEALADWFEEKLSSVVKTPSLVLGVRIPRPSSETNRRVPRSIDTLRAQAPQTQAPRYR